MTPVRVNVCVVGGGPAGMMLGLLLAKRGADVLVLEGHETFDREYRGEVLQPSTVHLLDQLGLLEYMQAQPHSRLDSGFIKYNGRQVGKISFDRIAPEYPYAMWMPQPIFLAALRQRAEQFPSFACWMSAKVSSLIHENGSVVGVRGVRHGEEMFEVRADVVVAADGRFSAVAKLGGFKPEYEDSNFEMIWFTVPRPEGWSPTLYVCLGKEMSGLLLPKYPHHIQAGLAMQAGEWRQWRQKGVAAVAERIRRLDPLFNEFADGLKDFTPFVPLQGTVRLVDEWARDGLLLIGDAAHTMSPAGAIGVNVALATAAVAAQELYPHLGSGPIRREHLQGVQRLREPDVRTLHKIQLRAHKAMLGQFGFGPFSKWLAPRAFGLVARSPIAPRIMRRVFFGVPLPPLDRAFSFQGGLAT